MRREDQQEDAAIIECLNDGFPIMNTGQHIPRRNPAADSARFQATADRICSDFVFCRIADKYVVRHSKYYLAKSTMSVREHPDRHSPDELWNGVDDSRQRGSRKAAGRLRGVPGISVVPNGIEAPVEIEPKDGRFRFTLGRAMIALDPMV